MERSKVKTERHPYEDQILKLFNTYPEMKFGEIIMRLGISARHGQKLVNSLLKKGLLVKTETANKYTRKDQ